MYSYWLPSACELIHHGLAVSCTRGYTGPLSGMCEADEGCSLARSVEECSGCLDKDWVALALALAVSARFATCSVVHPARAAQEPRCAGCGLLPALYVPAHDKHVELATGGKQGARFSNGWASLTCTLTVLQGRPLWAASCSRCMKCGWQACCCLCPTVSAALPACFHRLLATSTHAVASAQMPRAPLTAKTGRAPAAQVEGATVESAGQQPTITGSHARMLGDARPRRVKVATWHP